MLVLSRKKTESVRVTIGDQVLTVTVLEFRGDRVRLGFTAPADVKVLRTELVETGGAKR